MSSEKSPTLSLNEAAKLLRVGRSQVYAAAHRGDLPVLRFGKRILVLRGPLEAKLNNPTGTGGVLQDGRLPKAKPR